MITKAFLVLLSAAGVTITCCHCGMVCYQAEDGDDPLDVLADHWQAHDCVLDNLAFEEGQ